MGFAETYHDAVVLSRRDRSRRAMFWARILGVVLMLTCAAILRAEPDLRRALTGAGMDAVTRLAGLQAAPERAEAPEALAAPVTPVTPAGLPASTVKVNRFGQTQP